jgi:hypothetical protein
MPFHPENIPAAISLLRSDGTVPVLNDRHFDGGQCRIFRVDFATGESWSVRIPIHVRSDSQGAIISRLPLGSKTPWIQLHFRQRGWVSIHGVVVD